MAGTIDDLNFQVILNDDAFRRKIDEDITKANELNNSLSKLLDFSKSIPASKTVISKTGVKNAEELAKALGKVKDGLDALPEPGKEIVSVTHKHTDAVNQTNTALHGTSDLMRTISQLTGVAFSVVTVRRFVSELVNVTGQFEVQKMALTSMLQDADKADEVFSRLRKNALESPYTFQDLTKFAKQLTAFNIPADQLVETEKRLADVAAGLGVDMGRIILAYGQVKAAGVLKGTELRQFTEAGVPILEQLAKQIEEVEGKTVSLSEVFNRITKKQIPFEMVEEAFKRMTSEGGKFYNMQEVLVETLQGKIGKLRDVWQQALYDIGQSESGLLKGAVDFVTALIANLDKIGVVLKGVIAGFGAFAAPFVIAKMQDLVVGTVRIAKYMAIMTKRTNLATAAMRTFGITARTASAIAVGAFFAIAAAAFEIYKAVKKSKEESEALNNIIKDYKVAVDSESGSLKILLDRMSKLNPKTKAYADLKNELINKYGEYLSNVDKEKIAIGDLTGIYEKLKIAIDQTAKSKFMEQGLSQLDNRLGETITSIRDKFKKAFPRIDAQTEGNLMQYIFGDIDESGLTNMARDYLHAIDAVTGYETGTVNELKNTYSGVVAEIEDGRDRLEAAFGKYIKPTKNTGGNQWGDDWNPLGGAKETKMPIIDIDKILEEVDKELLATLKQDTAALDKQLDEYFAALNRWDEFKEVIKHTQTKEGTGAAFKLSGYLQDWDKEDIRILNEYRKQMADLKVIYKDDADALEKNKEILDAWKKSMDESNRNKLIERVRGLADDIMKEGMVGFDMTDWGDKSLEQINRIREALSEMDIPDTIKEELKNDDELLRILVEELKKLSTATIDKTVDPEKWKKVAKQAKYIAQQFLSVASSLKEFADASGNTNLSQAADAIARVAQVIKSAEEGYNTWGGWWGAVIGGATDIIAQVVDALTEAEKKAVEFRDTMRETYHDAQINYFKNALDEAGNGIFGDGTLARIRAARMGLEGIRKEMEEMGGVHPYGTIQGKDAALYSTFTKKKDRGFGGEYITLFEFAEQAGLKILDKYGNLNVELLNAIKKSGMDLSDAQIEWLNRAIEYSTNYTEAMKALEDFASDLFGDIVSDFADKIVDSWVEAGDAALDYSDILGDVAKAYAKMLVQQAIFDQVFNKELNDKVLKMIHEGDNEGAMAEIAAAMEEVAQLAPGLQAALAPLSQYVDTTGTEGNSLGNGIKSITETTASLLASYINAMRADLSVIRGLQEKGFASINLIGESIPTLNDYLNRIAANTYDTARNTQEILGQLQSVIGAEGSYGSIVRVEMV